MADQAARRRMVRRRRAETALPLAYHGLAALGGLFVLALITGAIR